MTTTPTPDEVRISESYQRVLDDIARCAQAVREGGWDQAAAAADQLARHATQLAIAAGERRDPGTAPRSQAIVDRVIATGGSGGELARSLHPQRPPVARPGLANPFLHPDAQAGR